MSKFVIIAIDGGAATGKSTTSKNLAKRLNLLHVDTGSHYRALTHFLIAQETEKSESAVKETLNSLDLGYQIEERSAKISLNGRCPEAESLRTESINQNVSDYAAMPVVRKALYNYQRSLPLAAKEHDYEGLVMEGRDIGTVILPDADLRVFLEADESTRSARRAADGEQDAIAERDKKDSSRKSAPLACADGALKINTGVLSIDEVIDSIVNAI